MRLQHTLTGREKKVWDSTYITWRPPAGGGDDGRVWRQEKAAPPAADAAAAADTLVATAVLAAAAVLAAFPAGKRHEVGGAPLREVGAEAALSGRRRRRRQAQRRRREEPAQVAGTTISCRKNCERCEKKWALSQKKFLFSIFWVSVFLLLSLSLSVL